MSKAYGLRKDYIDNLTPKTGKQKYIPVVYPECSVEGSANLSKSTQTLYWHQHSPKMPWDWRKFLWWAVCNVFHCECKIMYLFVFQSRMRSDRWHVMLTDWCRGWEHYGMDTCSTLTPVWFPWPLMKRSVDLKINWILHLPKVKIDVVSTSVHIYNRQG